MRLRSLLPALGLLALATTAVRAEPLKAAVFDFQFSNLSPEEPTQAERERLGRLSAELRQLLEETGRFEVVSTDPVRDEVARSADLRRCNGCAEEFAKKLGADAAVTGEVQKVSNLILNINVYVKPLKEGAPEQSYSVDIRGNTDESFERGLRYLVKNRIVGGR